MIDARKKQYEHAHAVNFIGKLGAGVGQDGYVFKSDRMTAVKFFDRRDRYQRELQVYQILRARDIENVAGHRVPRLFSFDESLLAIEISIVDRPFVLDFAGAKLPHEVPDFEPHIIEEHEQHLQELFGERWGDAMHVAEMFRRATGYVLLDIHPGNIAFADGPVE